MTKSQLAFTNSESPFEEIAQRLRGGDPDANESLWRLIGPGVAMLCEHHVGQKPTVEELEWIVASIALHLSEHDDSEPLAASVRRAVMSRIRAIAKTSVTTPLPSSSSMRFSSFGDLSQLDLEIALRYYVRGEAPEAICQQLKVCHEEFTERKSRAKKSLSAVTLEAGASQDLGGNSIVRAFWA